MKKVFYAENCEEILELNQLGVDEIIISSVEFSRFAQNTFDQLIEMIGLKNKIKARLVFEWDTLMQESLFQKTQAILKKLPLHEFEAIRVQDPGALFFIKENYSWLKIQLILETGNHNLPGLEKWTLYLGNQLERIVLSNELSKEHLKKYCSELNIPVEIQVFGRILLFYSPRKLLSPLEKEKVEKDLLQALGTSEESPHSGFPLIENRHGTFMFNVKDLSLLEHWNELVDIKVSAARFDIRFEKENFKAQTLLSKINSDDTKVVGPRPFIKGFYNINKTDVLFVKLKNRKIERKDSQYLGEVLDVEKNVNLCLIFKNNFELNYPLKIKIITPEGKEKQVEVSQVTNSLSETITQAKNTEIGIIKYVNGVTVKSQVYLAE